MISDGILVLGFLVTVACIWMPFVKPDRMTRAVGATILAGLVFGGAALAVRHDRQDVMADRVKIADLERQLAEVDQSLASMKAAHTELSTQIVSLGTGFELHVGEYRTALKQIVELNDLTTP